MFPKLHVMLTFVLTATLVMTVSASPAQASPNPFDMEKLEELPEEVREHVKAGQRALAKAMWHFQQAEELQPELPENLLDGIDTTPQAGPYMPLDRIGQALDRHRGAAAGPRRGRTRASSDEAEQKRREEDEVYDRSRRGFRVLRWGLNVLGRIPVVGDYIPGQAGNVTGAAEKAGEVISRPRDGMANINGRLMVWNENTNSWEEF